jgi:hypothetical protein
VLALIPLVIERHAVVTALQQQANALPYLIQRLTEFVTNTRDFLVTRLNIDPALIVLPRRKRSPAGSPASPATCCRLASASWVPSPRRWGGSCWWFFLSAFIMIDGRNHAVRHAPGAAPVSQTCARFSRPAAGLRRLYSRHGAARAHLRRGRNDVHDHLRYQFTHRRGRDHGMLMLIPVVGVLGLLIPVLVALLQPSSNTVWLMICLIVFRRSSSAFSRRAMISQSVKIPSLLVIVSS